jgi:hypothetical protein
MRFLALLLALAAPLAAAGDAELRPSARLVLADPDAWREGRCVIYREVNRGVADAVFHVRGRIVAAGVHTRRLALCLQVSAKEVENYTREQFNRLVLAHPCVSSANFVRDVQSGMIRLRVDQWETPHARRAASAGRLYRGMFIDTNLKEGMEIELEADLLGSCEE